MSMHTEKPAKIVLANRPRLLRELLRHVLQRAADQFQIIEIVQHMDPGHAQARQAVAIENNAIEPDIKPDIQIDPDIQPDIQAKEATWAIIHPDDRQLFESAEPPLDASHILMLAPDGRQAVALHRAEPSGAEPSGAGMTARKDAAWKDDESLAEAPDPLPVHRTPDQSGAAPSTVAQNTLVHDATFHDVTLEQLFQLLSASDASSGSFNAHKSAR